MSLETKICKILQIDRGCRCATLQYPCETVKQIIEVCKQCQKAKKKNTKNG